MKTRENEPPLRSPTPTTSNAGNVRRRPLLALTHEASRERDDFPSSPFSSPRHHHTPEDDATTGPTSSPPSASRRSHLGDILPLFSHPLLSSRRSCLRAVPLPLAGAASESSPSPPPRVSPLPDRLLPLPSSSRFALRGARHCSSFSSRQPPLHFLLLFATSASDIFVTTPLSSLLHASAIASPPSSPPAQPQPRTLSPSTASHGHRRDSSLHGDQCSSSSPHSLHQRQYLLPSHHCIQQPRFAPSPSLPTSVTPVG
ncbi:putative protein TPRXL [Zingiber officinale]|uniref:putative protein TPRXL n=1 Tax=Zingiber officinale TaxID=94328 RepID=UPI001C4CC58A|nr:putative protein TPRXL [Zingiber officinale]